MKRNLNNKFSGMSQKGNIWFALVFDAILVADTIYEKKTVFVTKELYDAVEIGNSYKLA